MKILAKIDTLFCPNCAGFLTLTSMVNKHGKRRLKIGCEKCALSVVINHQDDARKSWTSFYSTYLAGSRSEIKLGLVPKGGAL
jgi:hypothetical protein